MELHEKIESILTAYLAALDDGGNPAKTVWPDSLRRTDGNGFRIFADESDSDKDGQAILCIAEDAANEYPAFTGNFYIPVQIWLRTPVALQSAAEKQHDADQNENTYSLTAHKAAAEALEAAMLIDPFALKDQLNAVAVEEGIPFTCFAMLERKPDRQQTENYWASGWLFRIYCTSVSFPN